MKIKFQIILFILTALLLVSIGYVVFLANSGGYKNLFLAAPKTVNSQGYSIKSMEELNENKFMLTYENVYEKSIKTKHSQYEVTLKGTNYTYPFVMHYNLLNGGFFTEEAQENKSKVVVLNEKSSFEIFGGIDTIGSQIEIDNANYMVVGVLNDNDEENLNIYIPATCLENTANTFMSMLDYEKNISEEFIINEFKPYGIIETTYDFVSLEFLSLIIKEKFIVSLGIIICGICIFTLRKSISVFIRKVGGIKKMSEKFYFKELIIKKPVEVISIIFTSIVIISAGAAIFMVSNNILKLCLRWGDSFDTLQAFSGPNFLEKINLLQNLTTYSNIFFVSFILMFVLFFISISD